MKVYWVGRTRFLFAQSQHTTQIMLGNGISYDLVLEEKVEHWNLAEVPLAHALNILVLSLGLGLNFTCMACMRVCIVA